MLLGIHNFLWYMHVIKFGSKSIDQQVALIAVVAVAVVVVVVVVDLARPWLRPRTTQEQPDETFYPFRASKSYDHAILCCSKASTDGFRGSKLRQMFCREDGIGVMMSELLIDVHTYVVVNKYHNQSISRSSQKCWLQQFNINIRSAQVR